MNTIAWLLMSLLVIQVVNATEPPNDSAWNAIELAGESGSTAGNNDGATTEPYEPYHLGEWAYASVWWLFRPSKDGTININTHGSAYDTYLSLYRGDYMLDLMLLSEQASNDNDGSPGESSGIWSVPLMQDAYYYICVSTRHLGYEYGYGYGEPGYGITGNIALNWDFNPHDGGTDYQIWTTNFWPSGSGNNQNDDDDRDGLSNYEEWIAGTSPTNANSTFRISNVSFSNGWPVVSCHPAVEGRLYDLYWTDNITSGFQLLHENIWSLDAENNRITDRLSTNSHGFYHVIVKP